MKQNKNSKKILITGGAGYIGSCVSRYLLKKGYKVIVIDKLNFGSESLDDLQDNPKFQFKNCDIRNIELYKDHLKNSQAVIHLAALVGEKACKVNEEETNSINFLATLKLAEASANFGVKNFIFMSTASSYGVQDINQVADENTILNPVSLYAISKINSEKELLNKFSEKLNITIFRPSTVHGTSARMRFDLIVNHLVLDAFKKKQITILGPKMWRPLMWVGEPSRVFHNVLQSEESKIKSQVFNLGANGENFQKIEIAKLIKENFIPELKIDIIDKDSDLRSYKVNFDKISKELDYKPSKKIVEAMGEIFSSLKKNLYSDTNSQKYRN